MMLKNRRIAVTGMLLAMAACGGGGDIDAGAGGTDGTDSTEVAGAAGPAGVRDEWAVTPAGAGPVRIGSSIAELRPLLAEAQDTSALGSECAYVQIDEAPAGMGFMTVAGELVRIDVTEGSTPTAEGAGIGDTEARVMELYPTATRGPHKYTDGAYLVVVPGAPADTISRLVFETDGAVVTRFRAGRFPEVEWVEGCG